MSISRIKQEENKRSEGREFRNHSIVWLTRKRKWHIFKINKNKGQWPSGDPVAQVYLGFFCHLNKEILKPLAQVLLSAKHGVSHSSFVKCPQAGLDLHKEEMTAFLSLEVLPLRSSAVKSWVTWFSPWSGQLGAPWYQLEEDAPDYYSWTPFQVRHPADSLVILDWNTRAVCKILHVTCL